MTRHRRLLLAMSVASLAWGSAECGARLAFADALREYRSPPPAAAPQSPNLVGNPYLLWELSPGVREERGVDVGVNRLGLRGREVEAPTAAGPRRLVATGDSSVYGFGVADGAVFTAVAERALGGAVALINAAVPGYSTWQSLNQLAMRWDVLQPSLLLIGNLWSDNNFDSFVDRDLLAIYARHEQGGTGRLRRLLSNSAVFSLLDWRLRVRDRGTRARSVGWMLGKEERTGLRRVAIDDYAANLQSMVNLAAAHGAETMFILLANEDDIGPAPEKPWAWSPYRQVMRDAASRNGALVIDVPALFASSGLTREQLFLDEMHPTEAGHRLMGEALAHVLSGADWPSGGNVTTGAPGGPMPDYDDPFVQASRRSDSPVGSRAWGPDVRPRSVVRGVLTFDGFQTGRLHLDAIDPGQDPPTVLGSTSLDGPGPFALPIADSPAAVLRVYVDLDADGPDEDDAGWRFDLLSIGPDQTLAVDLDRLTLTDAHHTVHASHPLGQPATSADAP